jgi:hypothetical protein
MILRSMRGLHRIITNIDCVVTGLANPLGN